MADLQPYQTLKCGDGETLAYIKHEGDPTRTRPGIIFLSGFRSDMMGTKAQALLSWARKTQRNFLAFDYFGHGASSGRFLDGNIGRWSNNACEIVDELTDGPQIVVGSSMGGWIALLTALARPEKVKALVLIAPAPDFTERLMWDQFTDDVKETILTEGIWYQPSDYDDEPTPITRHLIEEGRQHLLLNGAIEFDGPVRILQGMSDPDVPYEHALHLVSCLTSSDIIMSLSKQGDHRLSTVADLKRLTHAIEIIPA